MSATRDSAALGTELTLRLNHWFFVGVLCLGAYMAWGSSGYYRALFAGVALIGLVAYGGHAYLRQQILVRDGLLFSVGLARGLGSCMSVGVRLDELEWVDLGPPLVFWRELAVRDAAGREESFSVWMFRGWRDLAHVVARLSVLGHREVEMSYETEKRLTRFLDGDSRNGTA